MCSSLLGLRDPDGSGTAFAFSHGRVDKTSLLSGLLRGMGRASLKDEMKEEVTNDDERNGFAGLPGQSVAQRD